MYVKTNICVNRDKNPEPRVFEEMAQSILAYFPITKGSDGFGWVRQTLFDNVFIISLQVIYLFAYWQEAWYDVSTGRGRLWKYAGDSRRKAGVKRKYEKKDKSAAPVDSDEAELFMKESEVAESNESAMVEAFKSSFAVRRKWIEEKKPLVTDIFERFPRYRDLQQAVSSHTNK